MRKGAALKGSRVFRDVKERNGVQGGDIGLKWVALGPWRWNEVVGRKIVAEGGAGRRRRTGMSHAGRVL